MSRSRNPVLEEAMERYRALTPLDSAWKQAVTPPLTRHTHPMALRDGLLTVYADSSVWANLLRNSEQTVIAALRDSGLLEVHGLRIRIAPPALTRNTPAADDRDGDTAKFRRLFAQLRRALD